MIKLLRFANLYKLLTKLLGLNIIKSVHMHNKLIRIIHSVSVTQFMYCIIFRTTET
jgi:hypothetical protein